MTRIRVRELEPSDWEIIEELFGARGACGGCWCMAWRSPLSGAAYKERLGEPNRRDFRSLVRSGRARGVLAFDGDRPVGWCSVGPRADFPALERSRVLRTEWDEHTWSVSCIFVISGYRGKGVGSALAREAVRVAARHGGKVVEAYPANPPKDGSRLPAAFAWTGIPAIFEASGFQPLPHPPGKRKIYTRKAGRR